MSEYMEKVNRLLGKVVIGLFLFNICILIAELIDMIFFNWTAFGLLD